MVVKQENGFEGVLSGISPADIIQLNCLNNTSTLISITSNDLEGRIFIHNGKIIHAETANETGETAFFKILNWEQGIFKSLPAKDIPHPTINRDWNYLLIEALRLSDENKKKTPLKAKVLKDTATSKHINIMVVDDSAVMLSIIKKNLSVFPELDIIAEAKNGEEAIEKLKSSKPDIILLDLTLPEMDGVEVLKRILVANPVPVLMMSALSEFNKDKIFEAIKLGAVDFVPKPKKDGIVPLSDRFIQMRYIIHEAARISSDHIHKMQIPEKSERSKNGLNTRTAGKIYIIASNLSRFRHLVEFLTKNADSMKNFSFIVYHPFPTQLHLSFIEFLEHFTNRHIESTILTDSNIDFNKKTRVMNSTIYLLPPENVTMIKKEDSDSFVIEITEKKHLEPISVINGLIKNIHDNNFKCKMLEIDEFDPKTTFDEDVVIINHAFDRNNFYKLNEVKA